MHWRWHCSFMHGNRRGAQRPGCRMGSRRAGRGQPMGRLPDRTIAGHRLAGPRVAGGRRPTRIVRMDTGIRQGGGETRSERSARAPDVTGATLEELAAHLAALSDADVAGLLTARPDLIAPPSASFTALAARAGARPSVEAALAHLDAPTLAVAEAVVALGSQDAAPLSDALGLEPEGVVARLERLTRLALVIEAGPVAGLADAFGPHPFGLGPLTDDPPALPPALPALLADPGDVSEAALGMLQALAWGPPVGTLRAGGRAPGAVELVRRGWLVRDRDTAGRTRFVMPRQVALALRGGLLSREPLAAPDHADLEVLPADAVAAEATRHGEEAVRLVAALLAEWGREGGPVLRTGGVGVRALGRTAEVLDVDPATTATLIEAAAAAGLLGFDDAGATWVPARTAAAWLSAELPERWAALAAAWATSARTAWLVGRRGDDGTLRPVLGADVEAAWARALRRRVLTLLDSLPEGTAVTPTWVRAALTFARPRRPVPEGAVTAVLSEAELLGLTGGGALSRAGRLLAGFPQGGDDADAAGTEERGNEGDGSEELLTRLEEALAADLPDPVDMLLVQSDLTAIVPGTPRPGAGGGARALRRGRVARRSRDRQVHRGLGAQGPGRGLLRGRAHRGVGRAQPDPAALRPDSAHRGRRPPSWRRARSSGR